MLEEITESRQQVNSLTTAFSEMIVDDDAELLSELDQMTFKDEETNDAGSNK